MDGDNVRFSERIIEVINKYLLNNEEISGFEIIPVPVNAQNKCPVVFVGHHLGIESWCTKHVYLYCYRELFDNFIKKPKAKYTKLITENSERFIKLLNVALMINPEVSTFWNKRRELVVKDLLEKTSELEYSRIILTSKGKCNEAFAYRRWVMEEVAKEKHKYFFLMYVKQDLALCHMSAYRNPNNYHSWNHRMWLMKKMGEWFQNKPELLLMNEFCFTNTWIKDHISDYSGFHYRQFCMRHLFKAEIARIDELSGDKFISNFILKGAAAKDVKGLTNEIFSTHSNEELVALLLKDKGQTCDCTPNYFFIYRQLKVVIDDLAMNEELTRFFINHEALWYHRRFLFNMIMEVLYDFYGVRSEKGKLEKKECIICNIVKGPDVATRQKNVTSSAVYRTFIPKEMKFIKRMKVEDMTLASNYEHYIQIVHGWIFNTV